MRVGLLGGSFDPVHIGHLAMAEMARDRAGFDQVWLIPATAPPHKPKAVLAPFQSRLDMLQLALAGHETVRPEAIEGSLPQPSYTLNTVKALRERHPENTFSLILGSDTLLDLPNWHKCTELLQNVESVVVMPRPGSVVPSPDELRQRLKSDIPVITMNDLPVLEISSSWLRRSLENGHSIRFLVPRSVEQFIKEHGLYGFGTLARGSG